MAPAVASPSTPRRAIPVTQRPGPRSTRSPVTYAARSILVIASDSTQAYTSLTPSQPATNMHPGQSWLDLCNYIWRVPHTLRCGDTQSIVRVWPLIPSSRVKRPLCATNGARGPNAYCQSSTMTRTSLAAATLMCNSLVQRCRPP